MAKKKPVKAMKKAARKPIARSAARKTSRPVSKKKPAKMAARKPGKPANPWFDGSAKPLIGEYAQRTQSFINTIADGKVTNDELKAQENRLSGAMKEVEPLLGAPLHDKITRLLCELAAYDFMQALHGMQQSRPETVFRG
jgi:hypothetical protein